MTTVPDCKEICPSLGHCCKSFGVDFSKMDFAALLPFLTLQQLHDLCHLPPYMKAVKRNGTKLIVDCTMLDANGLCSIYEDRPQFCKDFKPFSNALCCIWPGYMQLLLEDPANDAIHSEVLADLITHVTTYGYQYTLPPLNSFTQEVVQ